MIGYGKVVAKIVTIRGDGSDEDRMPDIVGDTSVKPRFTPVVGAFTSETIGAIATARPVECTVDADGVMRDEQGQPGVWLLAGEHNVTGVPLVSKVVVTEAHTSEAPLELRHAVSYTPPPGTTVQTVVLPSGAAAGQVLAWGPDGLTWADQTGGGSGGTTNHAELTNRDAPDQHPIAAITDLTAVLGSKADAEHDHDGTYQPVGDYATRDELPVVPDLSDVVRDDDPRLSDSRTPTDHRHGLDDLDVTGTPSDTTFLRGDGRWAQPPASDGGGVTDHSALTGLDDDDHPQYALADGTRGNFQPVGDYQPAGNYLTDDDLPDAPTWDTLGGKPAVIAAGTSQTAARDAIGAGTSSLQLGTGPTTAAAGDHTHSQYATTTALTSGLADKADADHDHDGAYRPASWTPGVADIPAGTTLTVPYADGWPTRPTTRADIYVIWLDLTGTSDHPTGALTGDRYIKKTAA